MKYSGRGLPMALMVAVPALLSSGIAAAAPSAQHITDSTATTVHSAQAAPAALVLGDLYRKATAANPRIVAAHSLANAAGSRIAPATRPPDPEVQLGFMNYTLPSFKQMDPMGMVQLSLMQTVPLRGKLAQAGNVERSRASAALNRADDVEWDVRTRTATAFYDLYDIDQSLANARSTFVLLQGIRSSAETMYAVGEGSQADVLRAQLETARMVEDTLRLTAMRNAQVARLNSLLNRDPGIEIGVPQLPAFPDTLPQLALLLGSAATERPLLKAGSDEIRAAAAQMELARRELWPDVTVGVQYGQRGGAMGTERMGTLMLGASLPVFARSRQYQQRDEALAIHQMAVAELRTMESETRGEIAMAYSALVRARNLAMLLNTTILPQAEAAAASSQSGYRTGAVDFMTLLESRMNVNRYRRELIAYVVEEGKAWAELEMLIGRELFDPDSVNRAPVATGGK